MPVQPGDSVREELEAPKDEQPSVPPDDLHFQSFNNLLTPDRGKSSISYIYHFLIGEID